MIADYTSDPTLLDSLTYIESASKQLLDGSHRKPRRAAYLIGFHASRIAGSLERFPEDGFA